MLRIKMKAERKIKAVAKKVESGEVGGLLLGYTTDLGNIVVTDAIWFKQKRSEANFQLDDDDLMDFTKNADDSMLSNVVGWWHSHAKFGTFWSSDDSATFRRLTRFFGGLCVGVVVNSLGEHLWRIDLMNRQDLFLSINDINPTIDSPIRYFLTKSESKEVDDKVEDTDFSRIDGDAYNTCPLCYGIGTITKRKRREFEGGDYARNNPVLTSEWDY